MMAEQMGAKRQEIDLVLRDASGKVKLHRRVIAENGSKIEKDLEVENV